VSSDGKWLECSDNGHMWGSDPRFYLYSTDLPFRRIQINLPPINNELEGLYKVWGWSLTGNNIFIDVIRTEKNNDKDFCIVEVYPDESYSYNVECYVDGTQQRGQGYWSISQDRLLYSIIHSDGKYELLVFDKLVSIIERILTEKIIDPRSNEIFIRDNIIWDEQNIFIWIGYQDNDPSRLLGVADRSVLYRISLLKDNEINKVLDVEGDLDLVSINSEDNKVLMMEGGDSIGKYIQIRDMVNGELINELPLSTLNDKKVSSYDGICVFECKRSIASLTSESVHYLFIWDWESMDYTLYKNNSNSLGRLIKYDGVLCEKTQTKDTLIFWYKFCR